MRFCMVCLKPVPAHRGQRVNTCSKQCVNKWGWMTAKERRETKALAMAMAVGK